MFAALRAHPHCRGTRFYHMWAPVYRFMHGKSVECAVVEGGAGYFPYGQGLFKNTHGTPSCRATSAALPSASAPLGGRILNGLAVHKSVYRRPHMVETCTTTVWMCAE